METHNQIVNTLLTTPHNVAGLPLDKKPDAVFENFVTYARAHWKYVESSTQGGERLLNGTVHEVPCGGLATALKILLIHAGLPTSAVHVRLAAEGYVWTDSKYHVFDRTTGNLRKLDDKQKNNYTYGSIFNTHCNVECGNKFYDPCLAETYNAKDEPIKERLKSIIVAKGKRMLLADNQETCSLHREEDSVEGFSGGWVMFYATRKNIKEAMGSEEFKEEMKRNHKFAEFVNGLENSSFLNKVMDKLH